MNYLKKKILSSKKAIWRPSPQAKPTKHEPPRAFTSAIEAARHYEETGNWGMAASAWKEHVKQCGCVCSSRASDAIEFAYAMVKAFEQSGAQNPLMRLPVRKAVEEVLSAVVKEESFAAGRPALFKGIDLLLMENKPSLVPEFLLKAGANLDDDVELRGKFLSKCLHLSETHVWAWNDNVTRQRINVFNSVVLDYCARNSEKEHITLFLGIRRYAAECLANGKTPSITDIRHIVARGGCTSPLNLEPVPVPGDAPKLSAFLDHSFADVAASLAFFRPGVLLDIAATTKSDREFERALKDLSHLMPRYCVITNLGYPMGGGESFMHQTCAILREFGFENTWVSFADADGTPYNHGTAVDTPYYRDIRMTGGLCENSVIDAIRNFAADIIHTQGISNQIVAKCANEMRIPCLVGYHFWSGLVDLGFTGNRRIMDNAAFCEVAEVVMPARDTVRYVASEFMADVYRAVGGMGHYEVFHPIPDPSHYSVTESEREGAKFVTQINLAEGKGGDIFLACVEKLGCEGIPFLGVHSEAVEVELLSKISKVVNNSPGSYLETYGPAQSIYARSKIVIIPSHVDETFCRVAFEAAANGIPVLSSDAGFIPYMLGEAGFYLPDDDANAWIDAIRTLYADSEKISEIGQRQQKHVLKKFGKYPAAFLDATISIARSKLTRMNIGFFTSWGDQGLGYQVRLYSHLLREAGYRTHVFSFLPYKAIGTGMRNQCNEGDWAIPRHADSVYYSCNDREHVSASEIRQFVMANRIGVLIYPEICWEVNWRTLEQLSVPGLFVAGVPNLETVRKTEVPRHGTALSMTLCPTRTIEQILYSHGVRNTRYIGHGYGGHISDADIDEKVGRMRGREGIRYIHIGGHNPKSRKQTPYVIEAFLIALQKRNDIRLTVTVMDTQNIDFPQHENIEYVIGSLAHDEVMELYKASDVSIQVSSHEGVGMGFYESLAAGTPVISLDVPPHNEVVLPGLTGWLLNADLVPLPDNDDPVSRAAHFDAQELADLITSLEKDEIAAMIISAAKVHCKRFDEGSLKLRLLKALK